MGKSKKRTICRNAEKNSVILKRTEIIKKIISDIRANSVTNNTIKYIGLFGITSEELSEAGAAYEEISAVKHVLFLN